MSIFAMMTKQAVIQHRDQDNDTVSATGALTGIDFTEGTMEYVHLEPGVPGWVQDQFGIALDADATIYTRPGADLRSDIAEGDGLADKVTIDSKVYTVASVLDTALQGRFLVALLRREA